LQPFELLSLEDALRTLHASWPARVTPAEEVPLESACGRVLAQPAVAGDDVPAFTRSAVDGYAVVARDTFGAGEATPAYLRYSGQVEMGRPADTSLSPGCAVWVPTGGMLPATADAVVMMEFTQRAGQLVEVGRAVAPGENVVSQGEDVRVGQALLPAGRRLRPADLGVLGALGFDPVPVRRRPRVAIISTGDEIVPPSQSPRPGQVRDINSYGLIGLAEQAGAQAEFLGIVPDDEDQLAAALSHALACDLVVLSGGSSVGKRDYAPQVINSLGRPGVVVHGVAVKPGKPTLIAVVRDKPIFGLPGHPVSSLITFDLFVRPCLEALLGQGERDRVTVRAVLTRSVRAGGGRREYVRVSLTERGGRITAEPILGKSALISTLALADGLVTVPSGREGLAVGEEVPVELLLGRM